MTGAGRCTTKPGQGSSLAEWLSVLRSLPVARAVCVFRQVMMVFIVGACKKSKPTRGWPGALPFLSLSQMSRAHSDQLVETGVGTWKADAVTRFQEWGGESPKGTGLIGGPTEAAGL